MNIQILLEEFGYNHEFIQLLSAIEKSGIEIERLVDRIAFDDNNGQIENGGQNTSGDDQKKLDVLTNDIMVENLTQSCACSILLSEEEDEESIMDTSHSGNYIVAFDPLDGSSNIDCNCGVGTIFSITLDNDKTESVENRILRNGNGIECSGYILYGGSTELVIAFKGKGVHRFVLDKQENCFIHMGALDITDKQKKIYSINESNCNRWDKDIAQYITQYRVKESKYTQRWIGSMVSDIHRTLLYGGMFCYPWDEKNINGKLRILYECFPMAMIVEEAGGKAIIANMSKERVLDIVPVHIHQRTPVLLGSVEEIEKYEKILDNIINNPPNPSHDKGEWLFYRNKGIGD